MRNASTPTARGANFSLFGYPPSRRPGKSIRSSCRDQYQTAARAASRADDEPRDPSPVMYFLVEIDQGIGEHGDDMPEVRDWRWTL